MLSPLTLIDQTWSVVAPIFCPGCGRADVSLCDRCWGDLRPQLVLPSLAIRLALFGVPVIAGIPYRGVARRVISSYKDRGRLDLRRALVGPLLAAWRHLGSTVSLTGVTAVCVPHSTARWLTTGRHPTRDLVRFAELPGGDLAGPSSLRNAARSHFAGASQKKRSRRQRLETPPRFVASAPLAGKRVVLVDDVVTTGISLEYAARAIEIVGAQVVGAVVVAATPARADST